MARVGPVICGGGLMSPLSGLMTPGVRLMTHRVGWLPVMDGSPEAQPDSAMAAISKTTTMICWRPMRTPPVAAAAVGSRATCS